ncbi:hypothetical protein [Alkaliphilus metalliredigens]|nr:hypothetical protein [Alkaliphilus metalliredigens]
MNIRTLYKGVLYKNLSKVEKDYLRKKVTDKCEKIISQEVIRMIEEGKSMEEIKHFLKIN